MKKIYSFLLSILIVFVCVGPIYSRESGAKVSALVYHSFLGQKRFNMDVSLDEFRAQLTSLKNSGYKFVTFSDMKAGMVKGSRNILITIDDGNKSVLDAYEKVLKPMGIKPLLAIYPAIIGKKDYALNWEQLRGLVNDGCEIASHGYWHQLLNVKLYEKNQKTFIEEIELSKKSLEKELGIKVDTWIFANGVRCDQAEAELRKNGFKYAFTITWGAIDVPLNKNKDALRLPRYMYISENFKMLSSAINKTSQ